MGLLTGTRRALLGGPTTYADKVLGYSPIAYWPLWETAGATANSLVNPAQNGVYTGVTLANAAGPDGSPCPFFDGANDYLDIYTAALDAAFNGSTGSAFTWVRVNSAAVWTDGVQRAAMHLSEDGNNFYLYTKNSVNNQTRTSIGCGGAFNAQVYACTLTTWLHLGITWAWGGVNTVVTQYINGVAQAPVASAAAQYVGNLWVNRTYVGALASTPTYPWHGWIAHAAIWNRVLTAPQIADLAVA